MTQSVAFYLPQFHPIPENDEWWGKGFTEWTNVTKARPLYKGHKQPFLPSDLGYYDLRVPEVRLEQAKLAQDAGIKAFCYWHYWFGNGERLLERPFDEVVESGQPDFQFCLSWANESWTGRWHGQEGKILIEQTYPGIKDYEMHFNCLKKAFSDKRYYKVHGKNIFLIYRPELIPDVEVFVNTWRGLAVRHNLPDFFFIGFNSQNKPFEKYLDGSIKNQPTFSSRVSHPFLLEKYFFKATSLDLMKLLRFRTLSGPQIYNYKDYVNDSYNNRLAENEYPVILTNWDNTPRCGNRGVVFHGSTPELYGKLLEKGIKSQASNNSNLIFIKSWNEWAEGNTLEPSLAFGHDYLKVTKQILSKDRIE